jgi:hypothetical protein
MPFDAYYNWLGIPPAEQPPNHYRLLGLTLYEQNTDAISHAADRAMAHVRTFQTGKNAALSQQILREIAQARLCLLDPARKLAYDDELRARLSPLPPEPGSYTAGTELPLSVQPTMPAAVSQTAAVAIRSGLPPRRRKSALFSTATMIGGGLAAILLSAVLVRYVFLIDATSRSTVAGKKLPPAAVRNMDTPQAEVPAKSSRESVELAPNSIEKGASVAEPLPPDPAPVKPSPPSGKKGKVKKKGPAKANSAEAPPAKSSAATANDPPMLVVSRLPVPSTAEQEAVKQAFEKAYALSRLKADLEKQTAIEELRRVARGRQRQPIDQYVTLQLAARLAQEVGDANLVADCIDEIARQFVIDPLPIQATLLEQCAKSARTTQAIESVMAAIKPVLSFALGDGEIEIAKRLADAAAIATSRPSGQAQRKSIVDLQKDINRQHQAWQAQQRTLAKLKETPDDAAASLAAGKWLCLERGDWAGALPYLERAGSSALKKVADAERAIAADAESQVAAADAWYEAGKPAPSEPLWLVRARELYDRAARNQPGGLLKARVANRLAELAKDDRLSPLQAKIQEAGTIGRLRPELPQIAREHCVLLLTFEPDDLFSSGDKRSVRDLSGRQNHGTIVGPVPTAGKAGGALQFDGKDDLVDCGNDASLNPGRELTICAWVRPEEWQQGGNIPDYIVGKDDWKQPGIRGFSTRFARGGELALVMAGDKTWVGTESAGKQPLRQWVHVAGVYDGENLVTLINGVEAGTRSFDRPVKASPLPLVIGGSPFGKERRFNGIIDEVAVFDLALTFDDIRTIYGLGASGNALTK